MIRILLGYIIGCVLVIPIAVSAQQGSIASVYGEALQNQAAQGLVTCSGLDCDFCKLGEMTNNIINWLFGFLIVLAVFVFAYAGFKLVTSGGNSDAMKYAKERFIYVVLGILLMLASWLIVDTIMRGLTGQGMNFWGRFEVDRCGSMTAPQDGNYGEFNLEFDAESEDDQHTLPAHPGGAGTNCGVNEATLVSIPGQGGHRAVPYVAERFSEVQRILAQRGLSVRVTSSYRSDARQTQLWDECPRCQREGTVARPCSRGGNGSRHTSGRALDLVSSGTDNDIVSACKAAGASFTMTYARSNHVHCHW